MRGTVRIINGEIVRGPVEASGPPRSRLAGFVPPLHRPITLLLLGQLLACQLVIIDDVHDHFFGTDQGGKPIVTVNAACQAGLRALQYGPRGLDP
jgi:hypothetical protein